MILLVDANNFYVSCERLFRPDLQNRPVVVLSHPNGCVIARSSEIKALGIPMGVPYPQVKSRCKMHQTVCFNANHSLYQDISKRMMQWLKTFDQDLDIYSIDEAFLDAHDPETSGKSIQASIQKNLGIPVSIGSGPTKTLAKLANHIAKQHTPDGQFHQLNCDWMKKMPVQSIWGIGSQHTKRLQSHQIFTVLDFQKAPSIQIKTLLGIQGARIQAELKGIRCLPPTQHPILSITRSATFACPTNQLAEIEAALAHHIRRAAVALHRANKICAVLDLVWVEMPYQIKRSTIILNQPTQSTKILLRYAKQILYQQPSSTYRKVGIILRNLSLNTSPVYDPLDTLMTQINDKFGQQTLSLATEKFGKKWPRSTRQQSPSYTTCWQDLCTVS